MISIKIMRPRGEGWIEDQAVINRDHIVLVVKSDKKGPTSMIILTTGPNVYTKYGIEEFINQVG